MIRPRIIRLVQCHGIELDVAAIAEVTKTTEFARLIDHAALAAGQTVNLAMLAGPLGIDGKTVDRWLTLLEHMFMFVQCAAALDVPSPATFE